MYRLAVVGTGAIFPEYVRAIEWLRENNGPEMEVIACVNRTSRKNELAQSRFRIPNAYLSIDEMMHSERVDGVLVLVPPSEMCAVTQTLIPYRLPLLIEKPPGIRLAEAMAIAEKSDQYQTPVMVGFNRRFYSIVDQAKSIIAQSGGLLGMRMDVFERFRNYRAGGMSEEKLNHLLVGNSIHCIDLIRYYAGEPRQVFAFSNSRREEPYSHRYAAMIVSSSDIPITYQAYWHSFGNWNYELYVPDGKIQFVNLEEGYFHRRDGASPMKLEPERCDIQAKAGFVKQLQYFVDIIERKIDSVNEMSIHDAVHTLRLVELLKNDPDRIEGANHGEAGS